MRIIDEEREDRHKNLKSLSDADHPVKDGDDDDVDEILDNLEVINKK